MDRRTRLLSLTLAAALMAVAAACGSDATDTADATNAAADEAEGDITDETTDDGAEAQADEQVRSEGGVRVVPIAEALGIHQEAPADLVVLDVRTPEEFDAGHIEGAVMLDFYEPDFATRLAELDPDVPYLLYCRSGNRSGQTAAIMEELGFDNVADVDGGVIAWTAAGHELVTDAAG